MSNAPDPQTGPVEPSDQYAGRWECPMKQSRVSNAENASNPSAAVIRYSHSSGRDGLAWTSVASATNAVSANDPRYARWSTSSCSAVHAAAARAYELNHPSASFPVTPYSWLPATRATARSASNSMHGIGSAP